MDKITRFEFRDRADIVRDIMQSQAFADAAMVQCELGNDDEVARFSSASIALSLVTISELILRGYTYD